MCNQFKIALLCAAMILLGGLLAWCAMGGADRLEVKQGWIERAVIALEKIAASEEREANAGR